VITSLRNRSLVESCKGQYWLHPVAQAEALERLRSSLNWQTTHHQAIQFWTKHILIITSITEATQALEAYYHALEIADYPAAAKVLLNSRHNQWGQYLTLGSTLYRMGLLQPVMTAIPTLLPHLPEDQRASELRNILADVYWISGQIHAAITTQEQARIIACQGLATALQTTADAHQLYHWRMLEVDALLSLGLYHLDLWELADAGQFFQTVIDIAQGTAHQGWADKASLCLALVASYGVHEQGDSLSKLSSEQSSQLADEAYRTIADVSRPKHTGRFAFFIQLLAQTYTQLGKVDRATELYQRAIAFADESHYVQVKAKALMGLGQLARQQGKEESAIYSLKTALTLLGDLGAKGDLAEAYYQLGLTYQQGGKLETALIHLAKAIDHFAEIQAPRQINKVEATCACLRSIS
ncbi:MAG: tetratricopeptide repeat protein, partial [Leptolyngbya sp. SIO1D8]|nr:tetratricopeptide repeat protein [Leptolyngbya sp. SIO1D8]